MTHSEQDLDAFAAWEREAWEVRAAPYAASLGDATRGSVPALLDAAEIAAGSTVLDVGTGPGFVALAAAQRGASVRAVDQSAAMVAIARAAGVAAEQASVDLLPFAAGEFGCVVGNFVLNHLARPEAAVAELGRVLVAGGRLALTVWDLPEANPVLGLFGPVVAAAGLTGVVPPGPDAQRFSADAEMHALLSGWSDVTVRRVGWQVEVDPGAWFDAVATATPRTGAVLAQVSASQRSQAREAYVAAATAAFGTQYGHVVLPAAAVLVTGVRP